MRLFILAVMIRDRFEENNARKDRRMQPSGKLMEGDTMAEIRNRFKFVLQLFLLVNKYFLTRSICAKCLIHPQLSLVP